MEAMLRGYCTIWKVESMNTYTYIVRQTGVCAVTRAELICSVVSSGEDIDVRAPRICGLYSLSYEASWNIWSSGSHVENELRGHMQHEL